MKNIIPDKNRLFYGDAILDKYKADMYVPNAKVPKCVVQPINSDEVSAIMKYCFDNNNTIIVRGGGTGAVGSQVPVNGNEVILDLALMNKIKSFDEDTMTLTVEPGVTLGMVQEYVNQLGYFYPPDPGSKDSTIGGNVSTNAGGMRAVKYGTTRNYVRSLEFVLPNGNISRAGSLNIKDSSGYDIKDLLIGSEGTLAVITEIQLKIISKPKYQKTIILAFDDVHDATNTVLDILRTGYIPAALELFEKETITYSEKFLDKKLPTQKGNSYVLLTLDGNNLDYLEDSISKLEKTYANDIAEFVILTKEQEKLTWNLRDNILYALMNLTRFEMLDEVVPINKFAEMIEFTKKMQDKYNVEILNFGHAGDGNIHTILTQGSNDINAWQDLRKNILDEIYNKVEELGGLVSAEHGVGYTKKHYFMKHTNPIKLEVMKFIKKSFDEKRILNPNKIFD